MKKYYYRNTEEIEGIDADSLWEYHSDTDLFVLVDEDSHIAVTGDLSCPKKS